MAFCGSHRSRGGPGIQKVKALAFHGDKRREVYDPEGLDAFVKKIRERGKTDAGAKAYRTWGTPLSVSINNLFQIC